MADISKIEINGETYDIKDAVARESGGGGDSKIAHGSFGEYEGISITGAGMIIFCGDNSNLNVFGFAGTYYYKIYESTSNRYDVSQNGSKDGIYISDEYGFAETLYTIIYV